MLNNSQLTGAALTSAVAPFEDAITRAASLWGEHVFQRWDGQKWRQQALAGLYDAEMIAASMLTEEQVASISLKREELIGATKELFSEPSFEEAVRLGTNTPSRIRLRIEQTHNMLVSIS